MRVQNYFSSVTLTLVVPRRALAQTMCFSAVGCRDHISYFTSFALFCARHFGRPKTWWKTGVSFRKAPWSAPPSNVWPITQYFSDATRKKEKKSCCLGEVVVFVELMWTFYWESFQAATRLSRLSEVALNLVVVWRIVLNSAFSMIVNKHIKYTCVLCLVVSCRLLFRGHLCGVYHVTSQLSSLFSN